MTLNLTLLANPPSFKKLSTSQIEVQITGERKTWSFCVSVLIPSGTAQKRG